MPAIQTGEAMELTTERHREIIGILRGTRGSERPARLSLEEFKALPPAERREQWCATWDPWRMGSHMSLAWQALLDQLGDREWHPAPAVREAMMAASGVQWRTTYTLIKHALYAGVLEDHRPQGSRWLRDRMLRLREDAPARLVTRL